MSQSSERLSAEVPDLEDLRSLDPQVLSRVHRRFFPHIFRYARYRVQDPALAEDITSETFLRLLKALRRGKGPREDLRGWLFGTASNLVNDHYRRGYRREALEEDAFTELSGQKDGREGLRRIEQRDLLRPALTRLTEDQQHVIALRFGSDFSLAETAQVVGKSVSAVKALQFRALAALRERLEEDR